MVRGLPFHHLRGMNMITPSTNSAHRRHILLILPSSLSITNIVTSAQVSPHIKGLGKGINKCPEIWGWWGDGPFYMN